MHELQNVALSYIMTEGKEIPERTPRTEPGAVKYLGVLFDNSFKFNAHIEILCCRINRIVFILWKSEHLTIKANKMEYNGLVKAHLNYGIVERASEFARNISSKKYMR